jgi:tetratricopeptide (TPR) repeat protein
VSAIEIFRSLKGDTHLSVARALDKLGVSISMSKENLGVALAALEESYSIRNNLLSTEHVDTLETLSNIAGVHLNLRNYELAVQKYQAVFRARGRVFGRDHPTVGVTAYTLAWILHHLLGRSDEARDYFTTALDIYQTFGMSTPPHVMAAFPELNISDKKDRRKTKKTRAGGNSPKDTSKAVVIKTPETHRLVRPEPLEIVNSGRSQRKVSSRPAVPSQAAEAIRNGLSSFDYIGVSTREQNLLEI